MKAFTFVLIISLFACGKQGPTGPQGPAGAGTRVIYQSTDYINTDEVRVSIPELSIDNLPIISIYVAHFEPLDTSWIAANYFIFREDPGHVVGTYIWVGDGQITLFNYQNYMYKIVLVL